MILNNFYIDIIIRLSLSVVLGAVIGFEREYRSKAAGFRTITIITLGSTVFTMMSGIIGVANPDRLAANIVTGIGFLGAGAIFKDGFNVSGLTTAATIWVAAAVGMTVGVGQYFIGFCTVGATIVVLAGFERIQFMIERLHQARTYKVLFDKDDYKKNVELVETAMRKSRVRLHAKKSVLTEAGIITNFNCGGNQENLDMFSQYLLTAVGVKSFDE